MTEHVFNIVSNGRVSVLQQFVDNVVTSLELNYKIQIAFLIM